MRARAFGKKEKIIAQTREEAGNESENSSCFGKMISAEIKRAYKFKQPIDFQPYISKETIAKADEIN